MSRSSTIPLHLDEVGRFSGDLVILTFCYNDWESLRELATRIDIALASINKKALLMVVDDGSNMVIPEDLHLKNSCVTESYILKLARNVGHQRAIAVGLCGLVDAGVTQPIIIMDCDGEDKPEDIPILLRHLEQVPEFIIVFAERGKRYDGIVFKCGYRFFIFLHYLLIGIFTKFGNFCVLRPSFANRLVRDSNLLNHFAATVVSGKYPYQSIICDRGKRYSGKSSMNLENLISHGLSAMSCYSERIGARMLMLCSLGSVACFAGIGLLLYLQMIAERTMPGWVAPVVMGLCILVAQFTLGSLLFCFTVLGSRSSMKIPPIDLYKNLIMEIYRP